MTESVTPERLSQWNNQWGGQLHLWLQGVPVPTPRQDCPRHLWAWPCDLLGQRVSARDMKAEACRVGLIFLEVLPWEPAAMLWEWSSSYVERPPGLNQRAQPSSPQAEPGWIFQPSDCRPMRDPHARQTEETSAGPVNPLNHEKS